MASSEQKDEKESYFDGPHTPSSSNNINGDVTMEAVIDPESYLAGSSHGETQNLNPSMFCNNADMEGLDEASNAPHALQDNEQIVTENDPHARADDSSDDFVVLSPLVGAEAPKVPDSSSPFTVYSNVVPPNPYMLPQAPLSHGELKSETPPHGYGGYMNVSTTNQPPLLYDAHADIMHEPHLFQPNNNMNLVSTDHLHRNNIPIAGHYGEMLHSQGSMNTSNALRGGGHYVEDEPYVPVPPVEIGLGPPPNMIIPDVLNEGSVTSGDLAPPPLPTNQINNLDVSNDPEHDQQNVANQFQQLNINPDTQEADDASSTDLNPVEIKENQVQEPVKDEIEEGNVVGLQVDNIEENLPEADRMVQPPQEPFNIGGVYVATSAPSFLQPEVDTINVPDTKQLSGHARNGSTASSGSQKSIEVLKQPSNPSNSEPEDAIRGGPTAHQNPMEINAMHSSYVSLDPTTPQLPSHPQEPSTNHSLHSQMMVSKTNQTVDKTPENYLQPSTSAPQPYACNEMHASSSQQSSEKQPATLKQLSYPTPVQPVHPQQKPPQKIDQPIDHHHHNEPANQTQPEHHYEPPNQPQMVPKQPEQPVTEPHYHPQPHNEPSYQPNQPHPPIAATPPISNQSQPVSHHQVHNYSSNPAYQQHSSSFNQDQRPHHEPTHHHQQPSTYQQPTSGYYKHHQLDYGYSTGSPTRRQGYDRNPQRPPSRNADAESSYYASHNDSARSEYDERYYQRPSSRQGYDRSYNAQREGGHHYYDYDRRRKSRGYYDYQGYGDYYSQQQYYDDYYRRRDYRAHDEYYRRQSGQGYYQQPQDRYDRGYYHDEDDRRSIHSERSAQYDDRGYNDQYNQSYAYEQQYYGDQTMNESTYTNTYNEVTYEKYQPSQHVKPQQSSAAHTQWFGLVQEVILYMCYLIYQVKTNQPLWRYILLRPCYKTTCPLISYHLRSWTSIFYDNKVSGTIMLTSTACATAPYMTLRFSILPFISNIPRKYNIYVMTHCYVIL
uniref:uncharacterized protein LOC100181669 isoform X1 n=1 Tax=Ciona intestinalis TaxID=7719 RepID=UPI00089DC6C7|nr:uncharacterized protein LOC100181669 isoform X1 [Ciona intestinalis]|eukprot:XP_018668699.1 uncharacterized protein LOC100181669 isoform X1 [Ciona intestinalis]